MRSIATTLARHLAPPDTRTDGDLLAGFAAGAEADFAELVRRHGPMVWGVCRRSLPDVADAEDAFQAVFLVLVRRAPRLTSTATVGPWLHRVAAWTARNVRRRNARRLANRGPLPDQLPAASPDPDLTLDLDAALLALPEKYRSPIVLCHLLGFTRAEAATRLGCPEGTLSAWLSRGLAKLRAKFGSLDPAKVLGVGAVAVPTGLSGSVVRAAVASRVAVAAVPSTVSQLVEGVIHMFWVKKATAAAAALFVVFALGVGVGMSGRTIVPDVHGQEKATQPKPPATSDHAAKIAELEDEVEANRVIAQAAQNRAKLVAERLAALKENKGDPKLIQAEQDTLIIYQKRADVATQLFRALQADLAKLKAAQPKPPAQNLPAAIAEIDKQLADLKAREKAAATELDDVRVEAKVLAAKRAELAKIADAKTGPFVEVTLRGEAAKFDFVIRETDANGKVLGTATVSSPELLVRLLARTKSDPAAPKELRLIGEPPTALGVGPSWLFKACDAAGYTKVKFTGYVIGGGFTPALKPGQKGATPGYNWYDGAERSPASLLVEHEKGMVTD